MFKFSPGSQDHFYFLLLFVTMHAYYLSKQADASYYTLICQPATGFSGRRTTKLRENSFPPRARLRHATQCGDKDYGAAEAVKEWSPDLGTHHGYGGSKTAMNYQEYGQGLSISQQNHGGEQRICSW